jgi:chromosomal replication initiator protein
MHAWEEFRNNQEDALGPETTNRWLRSLTVTHFDACNLYLEAKDAFQILWFEEHIRPKVRSLLVNNNNHPIKVHLTVGGEDPLTSANKNPGKKKKNNFSPSTAPPLVFSSDALDPYSTFEHFLAADSNQVPLKLFSELGNPPQPDHEHERSPVQLATFNPIYIYGGSGVGKTHLLMSVAHSLAKKNQNVFFVRAETFTEHVVNAIRNGAMQDFRMAYRHVDVLIIDDIHIFARKGATQEEFFHTFNALHTSGRQVILSSNTSPQLLEDIEARLVSRFEWGITLHLEKMAPSQLRQFILNRCRFLNFSLKDEIIDFLIKTFGLNTKTIQKALDTIILRSHLDTARFSTINDLSLETAEEFLFQLIEEQQKNALTPNRIVQAVADFYGMTSDDILGKSQSHDCSMPRQVAMFLCRKELKMPFIKIGTVFARDHSTVMSSVKQIEKKGEMQDKEICSALSDILRRLENHI